MICKTLEQLALGNALGTLTAEERAQFERLLAAYPSQKAEAAAYIDTAAMMAIAASPRVTPPADLRSRLLSSLPKAPAVTEARPEALPKPANTWLKARYLDLLGHFLTLPKAAKSQLEGYGQGPEFADPETIPWKPSILPGFRTKNLRDTETLSIQIAQLDPGASIPEHDHPGTEDMYLLSGHLQTEGRLLGPGDFMHFDPGSHHHGAFSMDGCHVLIITSKPPPPSKAARLEMA